MNIKYANPKSVNLIEFNSEKFASISKIYSFTTENISGYFNYLDFKNKNVLTVSASGDHIINAFYKGARSVTGFDINYLALVFTELKLIAIQELSYKQFLEIFLINDINNISKNLNALNYKQYIELREKLTENSRKILDDLYSEFNKAKEQIKDKEIVLVNSSYSDIALNKLPNHESYDIILMSNISDYIKDIYKNENYLEEYIKEIIYNFKSPNNQIVCAYLYNIKQEHYRSEIDNPVLRKKIFKKLNINFTEENFKSVIKNCTDSIIII